MTYIVLLYLSMLYLLWVKLKKEGQKYRVLILKGLNYYYLLLKNIRQNCFCLIRITKTIIILRL
nr:MAG TPA: hypothetical protein [Caudoviricetes sp.]